MADRATLLVLMQANNRASLTLLADARLAKAEGDERGEELLTAAALATSTIGKELADGAALEYGATNLFAGLPTQHGG